MAHRHLLALLYTLMWTGSIRRTYGHCHRTTSRVDHTDNYNRLSATHNHFNHFNSCIYSNTGYYYSFGIYFFGNSLLDLGYKPSEPSNYHCTSFELTADDCIG